MTAKKDYEVARDELEALYTANLPQGNVFQTSKHGEAVDESGRKHTAWIISIAGFDFHWKTGTGIKQRPSVAEVFARCCSEAIASQCTFDDWCANFGYDTDSRKALDIYLECQSQKAKVFRIAKNWSLCVQMAELSNRL